MLRMDRLQAMSFIWCACCTTVSPAVTNQQPAFLWVRGAQCTATSADLSLSTAAASVRSANYWWLAANRNIVKIIQSSVYMVPYFNSSFLSAGKRVDLLICIYSSSADFLTIQTLRRTRYIIHPYQNNILIIFDGNRNLMACLRKVAFLSDQVRSSAPGSKAKKQWTCCS